MCKLLRFSLATLLVFALSALAFAQSTVTGAIGVTVTDPKGAVVPGATVTVHNVETNKDEQPITTDSDGRARVVNLQPGTYNLSITASGFGTYTQDKVIVEVGRVTTIEAPLSLGATTATVEVTSEAPVINTTQQDFSNNMNQTSIKELPINGQRWSNFALLTPGTVPDQNFGLISFRGISGLLNNNTIDGGDNNQAFFSEERGRTRINYVVSQRAIREFQVNTSNYSAEYGRAAGGVTNAVTKSGTNKFHGDGFFFDRDNKLGARNPLGFITNFDPATGTLSRSGFKPVDTRYTFGGDIGGPIKKDKAFFFFNYDEVRRNFPGLAIFSSPAYLLSTNVCTASSGTEFNGPGNVNTGARPACNAIATGTTTFFAQSLKNPTRGLTDAQINSALSFLNSETGPNLRNGNQRILMPKVDINLNQKNTLTVTYNYFRWASPNGIQTQATNTNGRATFGDDFVNDDSVNTRLTTNLSSTVINEARYQWSRDFEFENSTSPLPGEPLTAPGYPGLFPAGSRPPDVFLSNGLEFGTQTFLERPQYPNEKRNQIVDMITMTKGTQTLKFGVDYSHVRDVADNLRFYAGSYSYNNINDFIIDYLNAQSPLLVGGNPIPCATSTRVAGRCYTSNYQQAFGGTAFTFATNQWAFFGQDDWRVSPRLTLNLGLRWEYQQFPSPYPNLVNPAVPQTGVMPNDKNDFGPRIGFALDIHGNGKDSLRGGYGIYYGLLGTSTIYNALVNTAMPGGQFQVSLGLCTPAQVAAGNLCGPVFPNTLAAQPSSPVVAIQFFQNNYKNPRIHQIDLNYEHEVAKNTVISFSLLASYGTRLPLFVDTNIAPPKGTFTYTINGGPFDGQTYNVPWFYGCGVTATCGSNNGRPNPNFGAMTEIRSAVWSKYVGGVVQFQRRLTNGLQFNVNYTRSKATDMGQSSTTFTTANNVFNPFDVGGEAGRSNFDYPNKLIANAVWQPHWKNVLARDWTFSPILSAYSGAPFTPTISGSIPNPGIGQDANCFPASTIGSTTNQCFTPGGGQNGSAGSTRFALTPRNSYRLPPIWNVDMRVSRRFRFKESQAVEVLIEGFNLFNRTQVTGETATMYNVSATNATCNAAHTVCTPASAVLNFNTGFQSITAAGGTLFRERQVQWAVRYEF